jgi:hypothetical protein
VKLTATHIALHRDFLRFNAALNVRSQDPTRKDTLVLSASLPSDAMQNDEKEGGLSQQLVNPGKQASRSCSGSAKPKQINRVARRPHELKALMKLLKLLSLPLVLPVCSAVPALASNPAVTSPYDKSTVSSPFTLTANASRCSSQPIVSMGYSLDSSSDTTIVFARSVQASVPAVAGGHTLHVKAWGNSGAVCVSDVAITVSGNNAANPTVSAPISGAMVTSPFTVSASSSSCSGQAVAAMGYSVDDSSSTTTVNGTVLNTSIATGTGGHTVHVKSWGNGGASCLSDVPVTVLGTLPTVPPDATNLSNLQSTGTWGTVHDPGTPGSSSGVSSLTSSPSRSGNARHYKTTYSHYGGQRYSTSFSDDGSSHNFVYDAWVYIKDSTSGIKNLEMDMNQVITNGLTVIMGFQCDGWSKTWDYTANLGSATNPNDHWINTSAACDPQKWTVNAWHHVQIVMAHDDAGNVTYKSVALDGVTNTINTTVFSAFELSWGKMILTNFQVDGATVYASGSDIFIDNLNVSYW